MKHRRADEANLTRGSAPPRPTPAARAVPAVGEDLAGSTRVLGGTGRHGPFGAAEGGLCGVFGDHGGRWGICVGSARLAGAVVARMRKGGCASEIVCLL